MDFSLRYFRANADGSLARASLAQMERWSRGEPLSTALTAEGEIKFLETMVEIDGRHVTRVVRILPFRRTIRQNGKFDEIAGHGLLMRRLALLGHVRKHSSEEVEIELLEADANYFWSPTDVHLIMVHLLLFGRRPSAEELADFRAKVVRSDDARSS